MKSILILVTGLAAVVAACSGDETSSTSAGNCGSDVSSITSLTGNATIGQTSYASSCGTAECHGPNGDNSDAGDLPTRIPEMTEAQIAATIKCGIGTMPAQNLDDQEIANVIAYVQATFQ